MLEDDDEEEEEEDEEEEEEEGGEDSTHVLHDLSGEDLEAVQNAWHRKRNLDEVLATHEGENVTLTRRDISCLRGSEWLNDEVINLYLRLLKERSVREPDRYPKVHIFNSFFYKKVSR